MLRKFVRAIYEMCTFLECWCASDRLEGCRCPSVLQRLPPYTICACSSPRYKSIEALLERLYHRVKQHRSLFEALVKDTQKVSKRSWSSHSTGSIGSSSRSAGKTRYSTLSPQFQKRLFQVLIAFCLECDNTEAFLKHSWCRHKKQ